MKIGLALSGGGVRGVAHAGVLKALEENRIKIDIIGGTSAGSMVSSLYAMGYTPDEILECFKHNYNKIIGKSRFSIINGVKNLLDKKSGLKNTVIKQQENEKNDNNIISRNMFNNEKISSVNFDATNKYITDISIGKAIRASSSFPAVFNLCTIGSHAFMDGGALNNVPAIEVRNQGADKVIAVKFDEDKIEHNSNVIDIVMRTIDIMGNKIIEKELESSDYVLTVHTDKIGLLEVEKMQQCFNCGYEVACKNMEEIKSQIL